MSDDRLTIKEVAQKLGIHPATVQKHITEGKLKAAKRFNRYMIKPEDLNIWAKEQGLIY